LNAHLHLAELGLVCIRKRFGHHVGDILHVHGKVASSFLIGVGVRRFRQSARCSVFTEEAGV
jgi:hypothetical protein